jgi:hypothetical protein
MGRPRIERALAKRTGKKTNEARMGRPRIERALAKRALGSARPQKSKFNYILLRVNGQNWTWWAKNPPNSRPAQMALNLLPVPWSNRKPFRRKQVKPPPVAPLSPATDSSIRHGGGGRFSCRCCPRRAPADVLRRLCLCSPASPGRPPRGGALQQPLRLRQLLFPRLSIFPLLSLRCKIRFMFFLASCSGSESCAVIS